MRRVTDTLEPHAVIGTIHTSLANARKRGEPWKTPAEELLGPSELFLKRIDAMRSELLHRHMRPARTITELHEKVLRLLEALADTVWTENGQSNQDPLAAILGPGTPNFFFEWEIGQPVDRLEVMMDLLAGPTITSGTSDAMKVHLENIRAVLPDLQLVHEQARAFRAKLEVLEKMNESIARDGHVQYARLRRRMRAEGLELTEICNVFPDIPGISPSGTFS